MLVPLVARTALLQERDAVSRTPPAPWVGGDLSDWRRCRRRSPATQQALPAGEAKCRTFRILQPDGHHQTMTTKAVHELTPGLDTARGFGTAYRRLHPRRSHGRRPGTSPIKPRSAIYGATAVLLCRMGYNRCVRCVTRTSGVGAAETGESVARGRTREREGWDSQRS